MLRERLHILQIMAPNTEKVLETVKTRIEEDNVKPVVVASTSGETGVTFLKKLKLIADFIVVSHKEKESRRLS